MCSFYFIGVFRSPLPQTTSQLRSCVPSVPKFQMSGDGANGRVKEDSTQYTQYWTRGALKVNVFCYAKNIWHPTSGSGGKNTVKQYLKSERTDTQTDGQTDRPTFRRIESIGPEGWFFEKIRQPLRTKKSTQLLETKYSNNLSGQKKSHNLMEQKKIHNLSTQPYATFWYKKIMQPLGTKELCNLLGQKNDAIS